MCITITYYSVRGQNEWLRRSKSVNLVRRHNKGRKGKHLTETEEIKKRWKEYTELYKKKKKSLINPENHDSVITHLEPESWSVK